MSLLTNLIRLVPPTLRANYCPKPDTWQQIANDLIGGTRATILIQNGNFLYNYGASTPLPENRIYPWINTDNGRLWTFRDAFWTAPHPDGPGPNGFRWIWKGLADGSANGLWRMDGGDGTDPSSVPVTTVAGSFWQVDTAFDGRVPIGVGSVPGSSPAINVPLDGTGGEAQHALTENELPEIDLKVTVRGALGTDFDPATGRFLADPSSSGLPAIDIPVTPTVGENEAHNNMQPYVGVYFIKRTGRVYLTLSP